MAFCVRSSQLRAYSEANDAALWGRPRRAYRLVRGASPAGAVDRSVRDRLHIVEHLGRLLEVIRQSADAESGLVLERNWTNVVLALRNQHVNCDEIGMR